MQIVIPMYVNLWIVKCVYIESKKQIPKLPCEGWGPLETRKYKSNGAYLPSWVHFGAAVTTRSKWGSCTGQKLQASSKHVLGKDTLKLFLL